MRISVVIPALNGERWIKRAVESALDQILIDANDGLPERYEVIVRDDGSTDGTLAVLKEIQERDKRLRVVEGGPSGGIGASFNEAFFLAQTEFVTVMGQDDMIDREYLARALRSFKPEVAMVACHPRFIDADYKPYADATDTRTQVPKPSNMTREQFLSIFKIGNMYFGINTYRRSAVIEAGGFDPKAGWLLDLDLYIRLVKESSIHVIEEELCSLNLHAGATSCLRCFSREFFIWLDYQAVLKMRL